MHIALKLIAAALAVVMSTGCAVRGSAKISVTDSIYETDISEVRAQRFEISGIGNREFCDEVNSNVRSDIDSALVSFDTIAQECAGELRMGNRCILEITQTVKYNEKNILSIVEEHYLYTGGSHGSSMRFPRNYDLENGCRFYLSDMFTDGFKETINRLIRERAESDPQRYSELWDRPELRDEHEQNFYIENGKLVIFFMPYELSYYAKGYVEFELPLTELSGVMKEEWRKKFNL